MTDATDTTQALLDRAVQGDGDARSELLGRYRGALRRIVASRLDGRVSARVDASDIVQDTLAEASRRLDDYLRDPPMPFLDWLRLLAGQRVAKAHRSHLGSQRRSVARETRPAGARDDLSDAMARVLTTDDTSPSNRMVRQEQLERTRAAMDGLSPHDREVLTLRYIDQCSPAEIAPVLGLTEAGVKSRLLRALLRVRALLDQEAKA